MISEQIIQDYLEQEKDYSSKVTKIKIALLLISLTGLLIFSL
jgi:hypothetical protein